MYDDPKYIKNNPTKVRLDTPTHQMFIATVQAKGMEKAVYAREAVERQLKLDNNARLQAKAEQMGMSVEQLNDYILGQFLMTNDNPTQFNKEGTENDRRKNLQTTCI